MPFKDREKRLQYQRDYNHKKYSKYKNCIMVSNKKRQNDLRIWYKTQKLNKKCLSCPESDWRCLDFHHRDPKEKIMEISRMMRSGFSRKKIQEEIDKCDLICSNCHRKITTPFD